MADDNPFAKFAAPSAAPVAAPAAAPATDDNAFAQFATPTAAPEAPAVEQFDTWNTKVGRKTVTFQVRRGADKAEIRAAAEAAGVPDPGGRSLNFGEAPKGPSVAQQENTYGMLGTMLHEGADFVMPFVDEIASAVAAPFGKQGTYQNYLNNMRHLEDRQAYSDENHGTAANVGRAGMTLASLPLALESKLAQGGNWLLRTGRNALIGSGVGGVFTYGSNPVDDRTNGLGTGIVLGGGFGAAAEPIGRTVGAVASRIDQRLGVSEKARKIYNLLSGGGEEGAEAIADRSAMEALATRTAQNPDEMERRAQRFRDTGHQPALVNVVDEAGRGQIGALARKPGPGRETAQRAAEAKALDLPDRMDRNMQRVILDGTDDPAMRRQLSRSVDDVRDQLTEVRSAEVQAAIDPIRTQPVPLTPEIVQVLDTAEGRRAIVRAMGTVSDPETRQAMAKLPSLLKSINQIDPRMPAAARQQITDQLIKDQGITVDIADRIARKFNALAETADSDAAPVLRQFARTVRDHARDVSPEYDAAIGRYADRSKSIEAAGTGEEFLRPGTTDDFTDAAAPLSDELNPPPPAPPVAAPEPVAPAPAPEAAPVAGVEPPSPSGPEAWQAEFAAAHDANPELVWEDFVRSKMAEADAPPVAPWTDESQAALEDDVRRFGGLPTEGGGAVPARGGPPVAIPPVDQAAAVSAAPLPLPSNRQIAQIGARRAVQRAAGENTSAAPGVARRMAFAPEQRARNNALFGPTKAADIENAMAVSAEDVRNFADIAPRTGSQTDIRGIDNGAASSIIEAAASAKSGRWGQAAMVALRNIGMRDKDIARIVEIAVDPSRTDDAIAIIKRYTQSQEKALAVARRLGIVSEAAAGRGSAGSQ